MNKLPVIIIGAGPVGLAAAAHLIERKEAFLILESGTQAGDNVRKWQHVPMFSPWMYNIDAASERLLRKYDWNKPEEKAIPTGQELLSQYILPLSEIDDIKPFIKLNHEVISVSRKRINKLKDFGRENAPFVLRVKSPGGIEVLEARAVIDASGTWKTPNPAGAGGLPAIGEESLKDRLIYGIPDVLGIDKLRYLNKDVAVIGGGHSAINSLLELADLSANSNVVDLHWILTKADVNDAYGGLGSDELPGRGKVGQRIKELVDKEIIHVHTPFFVERMAEHSRKVVISGHAPNGNSEVHVDEVIVATGLKPELGMLRELRISLYEGTECPVKLAPLIDPNIHSCGSVAPHGEAELRHPEKDFYIVGMKSYGRAPTFLLATGYEQVRSVVAGLVGDWDAAKDLHLKLPESGVCGAPKAVDPNNIKIENVARSSCCGSESATIDEAEKKSNCC